jgi:hypothetical protein
MIKGACPQSLIQGSGDNGEDRAVPNPHPAARTTSAISGPSAAPLS